VNPVYLPKMTMRCFPVGRKFVGRQEAVCGDRTNPAGANESVTVRVGDDPVSFLHLMQERIPSITGFAREARCDDPELPISSPPGVDMRLADVECVEAHSCDLCGLTPWLTGAGSRRLEGTNIS